MLKHARPDLLASRPPAAHTSHCLLVAFYFVLVIGDWYLLAAYWRVGCWLLAAGDWYLLAAYWRVRCWLLILLLFVA